MHSSIFFVCALLAVCTSAQVVNNLQFGGIPIQVSPNTTYTTGFYNYWGSQFAIWVPSNASRIFVNWTRSAADGTLCSSSDYAYLYGKWVTYPCAEGYDSLDAQCEYNYDSWSYSSYYPLEIELNAYSAEDLEYWNSITSDYGEDFLRNEWLYLDSYIDVYDSNCTATLQVSFDYCPANTIAAYQRYGGNGQDTTCVPYTTVNNTLSFTQASSMPSGTSKYYLVNVPQNVSGIWFNIPTSNYQYFYLYARPASGGGYYSYYDYEYGYDSTVSSGVYNYTFWIPNPSAGEWVLTVEDSSSTTGSTWNFTAEIMIKTCAAGVAADEAGSCLYPLTTVSTAQLTAASVNVGPYNSAVNEDCNWAFYQYPVAANSYAYLNITFTVGTGGNSRVFWRKNAVPSYYYYDNYLYSDGTVYFTPEDFYSNKPVTYYFGFCNLDTTGNATIGIAATSYAAPSAAPSASSTPAVGASSSPGASSSSGEDSSSAFSLAVSMMLVLACVAFIYAMKTKSV